MRSTSQISCRIVFSQQPSNMCLTPFIGAAYSSVQVISDEKRLVGSRVYIPTCLRVARDEDEGSLPLCFLLCIVRLETYVTGFTL
jgi:hypothetical protein